MEHKGMTWFLELNEAEFESRSTSDDSRGELFHLTQFSLP